MLMRIDQLQAQVRDLTGTVEELQHRNQQLQQQLQQMQQGQGGAANTAQARPGPQYRAGAAGQQQYSPPPYPASPHPQVQIAQYSAPAPTAQYSPPRPTHRRPSRNIRRRRRSIRRQMLHPALRGRLRRPNPPGRRLTERHRPAVMATPSIPRANPNAPGAPRQLGAPGVAAAEPPPAVYNTPAPRQPGAPLDLSSPSDNGQGGQQGGPLPPPPPINPNSTGAMQASLPPSNTPKDEFDLGYGYVLHKDYGLAEQTLRDFLQKYPSDRLTPEAQYWLGEALFQDKHYRDAAESFLAVSTKYETTARAPDALMRLGQSLAALGEKEAACASLGEVLRKYPKASPAVKQNVDREQKRVHC